MSVIIGFIDEASQWLPSKGTNQWSAPWPDEEERNGRVRRGVQHGFTWMVEDEDAKAPVATISCQPAGDPHLWHRSERKVPAVYVSRLVVRRDHGGQQVGEELVDWAGFWAARQYEAKWIRIDVWTSNAGLHRYYEERGFRRRRCSRNWYYLLRRYPSRMLFEKSTQDIEPSHLPRLREEPQLQLPASGSSGTAPLNKPSAPYRQPRLADIPVLLVLLATVSLGTGRRGSLGSR